MELISVLFWKPIGKGTFITLSFLFLSACAGLRPAPFQQFQTAVAAGQKSLETEMARDLSWARESDAEDLAAANTALSDYVLHPGDKENWTLGATPAHWVARRTSESLRALNTAFATYTTFLVDAAGGRKSEIADWDTVGENLNDALRDTQRAVDQLHPAARAVSAVGAAAVADTEHRRISSRRARRLSDILKDAQPTVQDHAAQSRRLIDLLRADLKSFYADQVAALHEKWNDKRSPGRLTLARSLFNLNEEFVTAQQTLDDLAQFYDRLPAAHAALGETLRKDHAPALALREFFRAAGDVVRRARTLEASR